MKASNPASGLRRGIGLKSATALVIANIIGAGIFTSTGFQAQALGHPGWIFLLWVAGGVLVICGALAYAELGAAMPEAGGEYVYLRESYGDALAFVSAFVSLIAGFAAPIASALKSLVRYLSHFFPVLASEPTFFGIFNLNDWLAIGLTWSLVAIHLRGHRGGIAFNDFITYFKLAGIILFILIAAAFGKGAISNLTYVSPTYQQLNSFDMLGAFASSLIFVMFCYSGWNAAGYVAGELTDPRRTLPRALLIGTLLVVAIYLSLNAVYFYGSNVEQMSGKVEIGLIAARNLFGDFGAGLVTIVLAASLLASASAMTIVGPRVYYAFGRDFTPFRHLASINVNTGAPVISLLLQGVVTSILILSGRVDQIQQYAGFSLTLFNSLAVSALIVLRLQRPQMYRPFRTPLYPFTPLLYLAVMFWTLVWNFESRPWESALSLLTVAVGWIAFYLTTARGRGV